MHYDLKEGFNYITDIVTNDFTIYFDKFTDLFDGFCVREGLSI